jgi:hypothetical protein
MRRNMGVRWPPVKAALHPGDGPLFNLESDLNIDPVFIDLAVFHGHRHVVDAGRTHMFYGFAKPLNAIGNGIFK